MQYLLTGTALLDLSTREPNPMQAWARGKRASLFRMSVMGIGMARATIEAHSSGLLQQNWRQALDHRINTFQVEGGRAIAIDESIVARWQLVRDMDLVQAGETGPEQIGQDLRLEVAVALALGLTLVEPHQPYHDQLRAAGMDLVESVTE